MFKKFRKKLNKLPKSNKSMIYLMWIYSVWNIISHIFINIYVFSLNKNIYDVLEYNLFFVTATFIGFSFLGFLMSIFKKNIKYMYYLAYSLFILAFILILIFSWKFWTLLFASIYWLGFGSFRCAVHTQELVNIKDKTRDFYSSVISSGTNIINIIVPLFVSFIFFIVKKYFNFSPYIVLFLVLPFVYFISFKFIHNIWDYIPSKIKKKDVKNFFNLKKYLFGQLYILSVWLYQWLFWSLFPIIAITILKTEVNVWFFEWIITFISTFVIVFLSTKRNIKNRIKFMWIISVLIFINITIFAFNFNLIWYIIYSLVSIILTPLYRISEHVFDLKLMDTIKAKWSDFFPAMIFREITLWLWRVFIIFILILLYYKWFNNEEIIQFGLISIWILIIFAWISISLHMKLEDR